MTQVAELPLPAAPRAAETRFVYSVCFAHFVSHYFMLLLAPLFIFIKDDFGVTYTELGLALTLFNIVSTVGQTPVGSWSTAGTRARCWSRASWSEPPLWPSRVW